jgi:hypothetical protein
MVNGGDSAAIMRMIWDFLELLYCDIPSMRRQGDFEAEGRMILS